VKAPPLTRVPPVDTSNRSHVWNVAMKAPPVTRVPPVDTSNRSHGWNAVEAPPWTLRSLQGHRDTMPWHASDQSGYR
jgi:hypothetical protein